VSGRRSGSAAGALAVALLVGAGGARAQSPRLYVTNQDDATVSIVDLATLRVVETLDLQRLGFSPTAKPHHAQVEPDGRFWYVTLIGAGKVLKLDRENRVVGSVDLEVPGLMSLHPSRDLLVVARSMSAVNPPRRIALLRRSDMTLLDEVEVVFPRPHALVVDPRGEYAYVASLGENQLASVRLDDGVTRLVEVDGAPLTFVQLAASPDGRWLAATAQTGNALVLFDIADPAQPTLARRIPLNAGPFEPVFTFDGRRIFVTNLDANTVSEVSTETWEVVRVIAHAGFGQPHGVALSPDGQRLFVSNRHQSGGAHDHEGHKAVARGTLAVICVATGTVDTVLTVGNYAAGVGTPPPGTRPEAPRPCR
jgi:DNA-binding beta-propeller fold protein YncE